MKDVFFDNIYKYYFDSNILNKRGYELIDNKIFYNGDEMVDLIMLLKSYHNIKDEKIENNKKNECLNIHYNDTITYCKGVENDFLNITGLMASFDRIMHNDIYESIVCDLFDKKNRDELKNIYDSIVLLKNNILEYHIYRKKEYNIAIKNLSLIDKIIKFKQGIDQVKCFIDITKNTEGISEELLNITKNFNNNDHYSNF